MRVPYLASLARNCKDCCVRAQLAGMAGRNPPTFQGPGLNPNPNLGGMMQDLGYRGSAIMTGVFDVKGSGQKVTKIAAPVAGMRWIQNKPPRPIMSCLNAPTTEGWIT